MGMLTVNRPSDTADSGIRIPARVWIAIAIALFSIIGYFANSSYNPITEKKQHLSISRDQEIALGLQSVPEMEKQYGGESRDSANTALVNSVGRDIVAKSDAHTTPYTYKFHLLDDPKTINAFALPGGQVFITQGLLKYLHTRGELASVLAHEIGHVAARHSAQHLAKEQLTQGLTGAAVLASYDPNDPKSRASAEVAMLIGSMVNLKFSRNDELEADKLGVRFASEAGYDPRSMIKVMQILKEQAPSSSAEFFSTHPNPEHRTERIKEEIAQLYPNGVPAGMQQ
jgi:predicted Zn-dependent protease